MADKPVFLFLGVYGNPVEARADLRSCATCTSTA